MNRRQFLFSSIGSALAASLLGRMQAEAEGAATKAAADAIIVLWMNGGPSQLDTWDPKPGTRNGGPTRAIATRIAGVQLSEHLPHLAERTDRLALLRGLSTREGNHDRARHLVHTGYSPTPTVQHPALGAWLSEELGPASELPAFVSIDGPSAGAGFLGAQHDPFVLRKAGKPPQNVARFGDVDAPRFSRRLAALDRLEAAFAAQTRDPKVASRREVYSHAVKLMSAPGLRAFDLSDEPEKTRAAYGDTDFGRGCLLARRLVESGVRLVEVALDGWDTHQDNFSRTQKLCGVLDPAMSALLDDLAARERLQRTLVLCIGEFGRTPKINDNDGRDHHPGAWSAVLAGGGLRTGVAHGETSPDGEKVLSGEVQVPDLFATLAQQLGLDRSRTLLTPLGRPISVVDRTGKVIREILPA